MPQNTFDKVVHLYENALHENDKLRKVVFLAQIKELIIYNDPKLLDNFFEDVLNFLTDSSPQVRQFVLEFIEEACNADNSLLHKSIERLRFCVTDENPNVSKKIAMVMIQLYKLALTAAVTSKGSNQNDVEAFQYSVYMVEKLIAKLETMNNGGFIMMVFKLLESIVIIQSERQPDSEIPRSKENEISLDQIQKNLGAPSLQVETLQNYGERLFNILLRLSQDISKSSHIHTYLQSLTLIAKQRPQYLGKVVESFESTHVNLPDNLKQVQVLSIRKALKTNLLNLLKHPASLDYQNQITTLLSDLGATNSEIIKAIPKIDENTKKRKKKDETSSSTSSKKAKYGTESDDQYYFDDRVIKKFGSNSVEQKKIKTSTNYVEDLAKELIPKLNTVINVADLVLLSMVVIPNSMPPTFQSAYTPIAAAGTKSQIAHLSRLLAAQLVSAGYVSLDAKERNENLIDMEDDMPDRAILDDFRYFSNMPSSSQSKMRPGFKSFNLESVTHQMSSDELQPLLHESYWRILGTERPSHQLDKLRKSTYSNSSSMAMTYQYAIDSATLPKWFFERQRILSSIPSTLFGGAELYPILIKNSLENVKTEFEVLSGLVMKEYINYTSFQLEEIKSTSKTTTYEDYDKLLVGILQRIVMSGVKQTYFGRMLLETPLITNNALNMLRNYCSSKSTADYGFQIVRDLIISRIDQRPLLVKMILDFSSDEILEVRVAALAAAKWLIVAMPNYGNEVIEFAKQNLEYLKESKPASTMYPLRNSNVPLLEWTEQSVRSCLYLFISLMPLNPKLLHLLSKVFYVSVQVVKHSIIKMIDIPIKEIGMESEEILKLIDNCVHKEEISLVARIVHILTDKALPTEALVDRLKVLYSEKFNDVRIFVPVLKGLTKAEIIEILPKLVLQSDKLLSEVFKRLLDVSAYDPIRKEYLVKTSPISPEELLVAVHQLENRDVELKTIIEASKLCFKERQIFTQERLSIVINNLLELPVLPTLFMRTLMQSFSIYPRMGTFVVSVLFKLIKKQIWKNTSLWAGFIRCCEKLGAQSYQVLLQLPVDRFEAVLNSIPSYRNQIRDYLNQCTLTQRQLYSQAAINLIMDHSANNSVADSDEAQLNNTNSTDEQNNQVNMDINDMSNNDSNVIIKTEKMNNTIYTKAVIDKEKLEEERKKREKTKQLLENRENKITFLPS